MGILRDTLFIGFGGKYVDSIYVKHLTKWIGGDFVDTCSGVAKGMNEEVQQPSLILYPNPATSSFTVAGSYALPATLRLYDLTGRQALGAELHSNRQQVDVGQLSQGMYLLRLLSSSGTTIRKLIIR